MKWREAEYLVAGGGITGALITFLLLEEGRSVAWVVSESLHTSTRAGAGVMNPVTGRNFVLSWNFPRLLRQALELYQRLEARSGKHLLHRVRLLRSLATPAEENAWCIRLSDPAYNIYMSEPIPADNFSFLKGAGSLGALDPVWRVDMQAVVDAVQSLCPMVLPRRLTAPRMLALDGVTEELPSDQTLILATGASHEFMDVYHWPLRPFKGEALLICSPDLPEDTIFHHHLKVVPLGSHRFWLGPSDRKGSDDSGPTPMAMQDLVSRFEASFQVSYSIIGQEAGVRPASVRRRPFAGRLDGLHPGWVINGMGTKGASLAPWATRSLVDALLGHNELDSELSWPWANTQTDNTL